MTNEINPIESELLLYKTSNGEVKVDVFYTNENMWMTQKNMSELFDVEVNTINYHLKDIFKSEELQEESTIRNFRIVRKEGTREVTREISYYNLDAIIAVGYRVNSMKATQFRIWATNTLKEFIIKGFVMDDERIKNGNKFGEDYFDELLERIKEIRASERRFYQKITDIFAECSYDYNKDTNLTKNFYATVQNKLHWAITGSTAAEIISSRADSTKENMGLNTWKKSPNGKIIKSDVTIAKNYLSQEELKDLNDIVVMYLDYAENQAKRKKLMSMKEWSDKLDAFLKFNEYEVLNNSGKVSSDVAKTMVENEYEKFRQIQDQKYVSDFDNEVKKYLKD